MKAMILSAGLGTRLKPLTDSRPKALVELSGRTLLEITIERLKYFGVTEIIINVHHFADMVVDYLKSRNNFGIRIELSREDVLLDTGGGLKKAAWFFLESSARHSPLVTGHSPAEPFILHNVDVISSIDLSRMLQFHKENHALATLAVQERPSSRQLLFNDQLQLVGRRSPDGKASSAAILACAPPVMAPNQPSTSHSSPAEQDTSCDIPPSCSQPPEPATVCHPERSEGSASTSTLSQGTTAALPENVAGAGASAPEDSSPAHSRLASRHSPLPQSPAPLPLHPLAFSGIHIISPRFLPMITESGIFSIISTYLRLSAQNQKILAFRADQYYWRDLGRPSNLAQAALELQHEHLR